MTLGIVPSSQRLVERAYQLARSGACQGVGDIKKGLRAEGFANAEVLSQLYGSTIAGDLRRLCAEARLKRAG
jgi:hypothetical protein